MPVIYLNQAGTSWPKPAPVQTAVAEALAAPPETWAQRFASDHTEVCRAFGVADESRLLLTPGATSAISVALTDHPWCSGDRVVISGLEHHALHRPALQLAARGVEVIVAPRTPDEPIDLEALEALLRRGGVRLVAMNAASNVTGEILPIDDIVTLAREHGALSLIDAAQIAGWIPLDIDRLGADLLAFAGHKGPQAPWGIGGLYIAPHIGMTSPTAACDNPAKPKSAACESQPGYCDVGSVDRAALSGLAAGLRWLAEPERRDRLDTARTRAAKLSEKISELRGVTVHSTSSPAARMPTLAVTVEGPAPEEIALALAERGVIASGGLQCAPLAHETLGTAPDGVLRFSFGPSNADDDADAAADALRECLASPATR